MAEVRLSINQSFMDQLKRETGVDQASQLTKDALTLLDWAVTEVKKGRVLISVDEHGGDPRKFITNTLERAKLVK